MPKLAIISRLPGVDVSESVACVHVLVEDSNEVNSHVDGLLSHADSFSTELHFGFEILERVALG